jgi:retron-type reverse transcriptase
VESTKQVVRKYASDLKEIKHGVPQWSVLSPILFLLYISDLPINIQGPKTILFANDTNIQIKAVYEDALNQKIELCSSYKFGFI